MKSLLVCVSTSNGNTRRVADRIAQVLDARVVAPEDVDVDALGDYDLVGFGSGIYFMAAHPRLKQLIGDLPRGHGQSVFTFFTSGGPELPLFGYSRGIRDRLAAKGFDVLGSFSCRGLDTVGPLGWIGGVNRGRPNDDDLDRAATFALRMRDRVTPNRTLP